MKTFKVGTLTVRIEQDQDAEPPQSTGILIYYRKGSRYCLGEVRETDTKLEKLEVKVIAGSVWGLPVYAHVHSGTVLSTTPFSCPWDSGRSGIAICEKKLFDNEEDAHQAIRAHVEAFNQYLRGDVWTYTIEDQSGETVGGCSGFYGLDHCEREAKEEAEHLNKDVEAEANDINQAITIE